MKKMNSVRQLSVAELRQKLADKEDIVLVDVREQWEHELYNIGGMLIPLSSFSANISKVPLDKPVIVYCQKGIRSIIAIQRIQEKEKNALLFNLTGGMDAWQKEK